MSLLSVKLGDLNPEDDSDRWFIWLHAVEEFLWPSSANVNERRRLSEHPMYFSWCSEWAHRQDILESIFNFLYPDSPPLEMFYAKESLRFAEAHSDGGFRIASDLERIWEDSWTCLVEVPNDGRFPTPRHRQSTRGLKLSLLSLVLRLGIRSGSSDEKLVPWNLAVDAASLHLALSVLWSHSKGDKTYLPLQASWNEVATLAARKLDCCSENPKELKGHAEHESIDGYRKRLRATLSEAGFQAISKLAVRFEIKGKSGLDKWRKDSHLYRWFD